jgi:hypothetical protein
MSAFGLRTHHQILGLIDHAYQSFAHGGVVINQQDARSLRRGDG